MNVPAALGGQAGGGTGSGSITEEDMEEDVEEEEEEPGELVACNMKLTAAGRGRKFGCSSSASDSSGAGGKPGRQEERRDRCV